LLSKAQDSVLRALFGGGVIRGVKLQRGSVYTFEDVDLNVGSTSTADITALYENNSFVQKVFPVPILIESQKEKKFQSNLAQSRNS